MSDDHEKQPVILSKEELHSMMKSTVKETLISLGLDMSDPIEVQRDFQFIRDWRETTESVKKKTVFAVVSVLVLGLLGMLWLGLKGVRHSSGISCGMPACIALILTFGSA